MYILYIYFYILLSLYFCTFFLLLYIYFYTLLSSFRRKNTTVLYIPYLQFLFIYFAVSYDGFLETKKQQRKFEIFTNRIYSLQISPFSFARKIKGFAFLSLNSCT